MSMTDEGTRPPNQPASSPSEDTPSAESEARQPGGGLPGLAAFGQMQGYQPVTGEQHADASVQQAEDYEAPVQDHHDDAYTSDYPHAQDHSQDYVQEPQMYPEQDAPAFLDSGVEENGADPSFSNEDIQNYMAGHEAHDETLNSEAAFQSDATAYDGGNSLQTFEANYDQHPEIPLGVFEEPGEAQGEQPFFHDQEGQAGDAEFLAGESLQDAAVPKERRGRKVLMAASGLIGVLALGGALAFAYKIGGDSDIARASKPPLIQADSRPVKVAPEKPGGKEFPHANKKIYERLGGEKSNEVVKIKPRQEDVAAAATTAVGTGQSTQSAAVTPAGAPRKVKTLTVRPDGTIEAPAETRQKVIKAPPAVAVGPNSAPDGTVTMTFPTSKTPEPKVSPKAEDVTASAPPPVTPTIPKPAAATPPPAQTPAPSIQASAPQQQAAAAQAPAVAAPPPVQKPPVPRAAAPAPAQSPQQQTASAPAAAPAASASSYVVQVAARKSQTDALAAFADIQQKYPQLLNGYRPIINRADLGDKGVWYRLNVGPVESKKVASALCGQLKGAGMRSCIVRAQ